jgi:hypothetical protein
MLTLSLAPAMVILNSTLAWAGRLAGPVLDRELRVLSRGRWAYTLRAGYQRCILLLLSFQFSSQLGSYVVGVTLASAVTAILGGWLLLRTVHNLRRTVA